MMNALSTVTPNFIRRSAGWLLLPVLMLISGVVFGQTERERWLSRLTAGNEEERLDAMAHLVVMFSAASDSSGAANGLNEENFSAITALALALRKDASPVVRALAARALEVCGDRRAAEPLMSALGEEREIAVRKAIIYAFARHPSPQAAAHLIPLLKDKQPDIRGSAAFALAEIRDPASATALLDLIKGRRKDEDAFARAQAIRGLGLIGDRTATDSLLTALKKDDSPDVRREAARALGRIATGQDVKTIEALRAAQLSSDPYLTGIATEAIAAINTRALRSATIEPHNP